MALSTESHSILALAEQVLVQTKEVTKYYQRSGLASPTFAADSVDAPNTPEYAELHLALKTNLEDLGRLIDGPTKFFRAYCVAGYEIGAFQVALDFEFFSLIPAEKSISYVELAQKSGLDLDRTRRVIRILITHRIFQEAKPEFVSHNSFSYAMRDSELRAMVHYSQDEMLKAVAETGTFLKKNAHSVPDSKNCPFFFRFGTPIFDYYAQDPDRAQRFARAMAGYRRMENNVVELRDKFAWNQLKGTVVDIGGGSGHVAMVLARAFPHLHFEVQDGVADMLVQGKKDLAGDLQGQVSFRHANFFEPQQHMGAAAYVIRQCTHNWADHDVVRMFKAVVPGLEGSPPGTPLLINDIILPVPGTIPRLRERGMRQGDMVMMVCYGAKQRNVAEFTALLKEADQRYEIRKCWETGSLGLLEIYLNREILPNGH